MTKYGTCTNCFEVFNENHLTPVVSIGKEFRDCPKCYQKYQSEIKASRPESTKVTKVRKRRYGWNALSDFQKEEVAQRFKAIKMIRKKVDLKEAQAILDELNIKLKVITVYNYVFYPTRKYYNFTKRGKL